MDQSGACVACPGFPFCVKTTYENNYITGEIENLSEG